MLTREGAMSTLWALCDMRVLIVGLKRYSVDLRWPSSAGEDTERAIVGLSGLKSACGPDV